MKTLLTNRQKEIIEYQAEGYSAKEIAELLFVSVDTINDHIKRAKQALGVNKQTELVKYYYQQRFGFTTLKPIWRQTMATLAILLIVFVEVAAFDTDMMRRARRSKNSRAKRGRKFETEMLYDYEN